jgi:hypothetical protein
MLAYEDGQTLAAAYLLYGKAGSHSPGSDKANLWGLPSLPEALSVQATGH